MAFRPDLLRGLRETKGFSQEKLAEIAGLSQSVITKAEQGKSVPGGDVLDKLASALDCTMDYLFGRGDAEYGGLPAAAAKMAFDVFARQASVTEQQRDRCRPALSHPDAPKTAKAWYALAEIIDLAIERVHPSPANLSVVKQPPGRSKPGAISNSQRR
jgi:transcriptional regulator with XRE-family HTH domain